MNSRKRRAAGELSTIVVITVLLLFGSAHAQEEWELRVCADPAALPFSNRAEEGFENHIAEILADELGARLSYDWYPFGADMIDLRLREGECDLIMGVPDGYDELLTGITYYRSPYVFVYRVDAPFKVESFDDPVLHELRIAIQNVGIPPHEALLNRGLAPNVVLPTGERRSIPGTDPSAWVINAVSSGEVDVGIAWGPVAGYYGRQQSAELEIVPVAPAFEPPFQVMSFPMTFGVRRGDESLRDRLDLALAARWGQIQVVLREYGVPLESSPRPEVGVSNPLAGEAVRVGLVIPTLTGVSAVEASLYDLVGQAARMGALLAESDVDAHEEREGGDLDVLLASSPSVEAARRAGERLLATEGVIALVGGVGRGQAEVLSELAREREVLFLNIGSPSLLLRRTCNPYAFHLEASAAMYLDALVDWFSTRGGERWFIVYEDDVEGRTLQMRALEAIARQAGVEVVGSAAVVREQPSYIAELDTIQEADADTLLLLLGPRDQIGFLAQMQSVGPTDMVVAPFPYPVTQTRDYLAAARLRAGDAGQGQRVALWDTTLDEHGAADLNERFMARWGLPMEGAAWAAYQAVRILHQAVEEADATEADALIELLENSEALPWLTKGPGVSFQRWDHQLQQPLYIVEVDSDAEWGNSLSSQVAIAKLAAELLPPEQGGEEAGCSF